MQTNTSYMKYSVQLKENLCLYCNWLKFVHYHTIVHWTEVFWIMVHVAMNINLHQV